MTDTERRVPRTAAATAASVLKRRRQRDDRLAAKIRTSGWLAVPPEDAARARTALTAAGIQTP